MRSSLHGTRLRWMVVPVVAALAGVALWLGRGVRGPEPEVRNSEVMRIGGVMVLRGQTNRAFEGWVTEQYATGVQRSRTHVVRGRLDGISEGWYTNGMLQVREVFVAGVAEGPVTKWHSNGAKLSEGIARAGKLEGQFRRWHDNGVPAEEVALHLGEPQGPSRAWYPSGSLKAEAMFENGRMVSHRFWKDGEHPTLAAASSRREEGP